MHTASGGACLASSENPSLVGNDVIITAMVSGNDGAGDLPGGNVEFLDNGKQIGSAALNTNGSAIFDTSGTLAAGSHAITAHYEGDSHFVQSLSNLVTEIVNPPGLVPLIAATTLPTAAVAGTKVHCTVTVAITNKVASSISAQTITVVAMSQGTNTKGVALISKTVKRGFAVKAGQTRDLKLTVSLPATLNSGTYDLLAQVTNSLVRQVVPLTGRR